jgi:hypothetical protein
MKKYLLILLFFVAIKLHAQEKIQFFTSNSDSTQFTLTAQGASHLASLPMRCILQQYPNKINHTAIADSDQMLTPFNSIQVFMVVLIGIVVYMVIGCW